MVAGTESGGVRTVEYVFKCMVCGSAESVARLSACRDLYLGNPMVVDYVRCVGCGLVQQHPLPADPGALYSGYPVHEKKSGLHDWFRRSILKGVYFSPEGLATGSRLLDFGCGDGWYLDSVKDSGLQCEGYEFQRNHAARLQSTLGLPIFSDLDSLVAQRCSSYQAITLHNVLEHVVDPRSTITALARLLAPGGVIFVSVPNADSWEAKLFGRRWHGLDPPRHISFPSPSIMSAVATSAGLQLDSVKKVPFPYTSAASLVAALTGRYNHALFLLSLPLGLVLSQLAPSGTLAFLMRRP